MSNNLNNNAQGNQTPDTGDKTFTQDDVNRIVGERLAEDRKKASAELEQKEKDLQRRELSLKAKELLLNKKLSLDLIELVNLNDEESMSKSIELIEKNFQPNRPKLSVDGPVPAESLAGMRGSDSSIRGAMGLD